MFNKKRIFIFVIFLLCLFFLMTFAGGSRDEGIVTRLVEFYDGFDDSLISSTKVEVGKDAEVPEDPEHENYVFAGWYLYEDHDVKVTKFTDIREDLKVIALYADDLNNNGIADNEEDKLTVTFFDTLGNRVLKEEEVLPGLDATAPEIPTYDGYEFGGWSRGYTNVTEDITVNTIYNNTVAPTINISADNLGSMLVYENVPTFTATATDRNGNPVEVVITTNIDGNTAGSYTVTYTATDNDGNTTTITRDFVVERRNLEVTIDDKTSVYGEALEELTYEITDGVVVEEYLPGITLTKANGTNVGRYAITGTYSNRNYNITFINGIYTITKANYDVNVEFPQEDELVYDGEEQEPIVIEELPETVIPEITYKDEEGNPVDKPVDAGDYDVEITFTCTDDNYNCPEKIEGVITINKAPLTVVTENATKVYDGTALTANGTITGLVNGETATLNVTGTQTDVGTSDNTYTITWGTAKETNYEVKETIGTLTVTQKDITDLTEEEIKDLLGITYNDLTVIYDGNEHEVVITDELPEGIEVSYTGNKGTNAGTYNGVATLTGSGNYAGSTTLTATLTISKATYDLSGVKFEDKTVEYDGKEHKIEITGTLPEGVTVEYTNNTGVNAGKYKATATFKGNENYNEIASMNATLTITAKEITEEDIAGYVFDGKEETYNGEIHSLELTGLDTSKFSVSYEGNNQINAEEYTVTAIITGIGNYTGTIEKTATLKINKADISFVADNKTSEKGENLVNLTYKTIGTIYGEDNLNINISTDANKDIAGTYDIVITASNSNYNISLTNAKYKVFNDENNNGKDDDDDEHYTVTFVSSGRGHLEGTLEYAEVLTGLTLEQAGIIIPTVVADKYYEFKNWTPSIPTNETVVDGNLTFTAVFGPINDENNNGIADEEETYKVTFVDYDETVLSEQTVLYGESAVAPENPSRENWTFTGWDKEFTNITSELVVTAQYTPNQIGIRVEEKPNVMFQFQKGSTPDFTKLINVYEVYADGSEVETFTYTTDVDTSSITGDNKRTLTITENGFTNTDIKYSVINEEAYQSKFEINFTGENFYYKTKNSFWGGSCTTNCDSPENTTKVETNYNFIEIVEHYDETIKISDVYVTYTNGESEFIKVSDSVRWTHVSGNAYYNPVYIGTTNRTVGNWWDKETADIMDENYIIDTVTITYNRDGYGRYTVYFKYDASTKTFSPYDEVKVS